MAGFDEMLVSARSLAEYRAMFSLSNADLHNGKILDCPSGAASFGPEARALGAAVIGIDPAYSVGWTAVVSAARESVERASRYSVDHADKFVWGWFSSTAQHRRERRDACERFAIDFAKPRGYVAGALPVLPFADRSFSLALSSHLLFVWTDRFGPTFHRQSIEELVRVTDGEVRLFPIIDSQTVRYPHLDQLRAELATVGVESLIRPVDYVVQVGGGELLVCRRR